MSHAEQTLSLLALNAAAKGIQTLAPAQARTLRAGHATVLRMARGAAWVTRCGPHAGTAEGGPQGDLLLEAGEQLHLNAGETLVLEPIGQHGQAPRLVAFDWHEAERNAAPLRWEQAVGGPAGELAQSLSDVGQALVRLGRGALAWSLQRLPLRAHERLGTRADSCSR